MPLRRIGIAPLGAVRGRSRWGAFLLGLAVVAGVLVAPAPAQADPYWRVRVYVTAGKGSCTLRWVRSYWDGPVNAYKVWVVPQDVGPNAPQTYRQISVTPPLAGRAANVKVGSLTRGAAYVFWLQAFFPSYFRSGPINMQVATTEVCVPT